jgi:antitoxin (DNA-binding transcriptional repressor) of toxin-antitoxin stability system
MRVIDAQELGQKANEILRDVESGQTIEVVRKGRLIARIEPAHNSQPITREQKATDRDANGAWSEMLQLIEEIGNYLPEHVDAVETVREIRREL